MKTEAEIPGRLPRAMEFLEPLEAGRILQPLEARKDSPLEPSGRQHGPPDPLIQTSTSRSVRE